MEISNGVEKASAKQFKSLIATIFCEYTGPEVKQSFRNASVARVFDAIDEMVETKRLKS